MQQAKLKGMTSAELDELAINTIRTLSIDAVQQAKSGHPGTPMALAPLVYMIWNEVMRFDPQDPIWPNRDRFVLSNGHASMLLWSVLYLTGTRAVNADYERLGQPAVTLDDIQPFPPARQQGAGTSGISLDVGRGGDDRPARPGHRQQRRHGDRAQVARRADTTSPASKSSTTTSMPFAATADLMEGVGSEAASLAGHLGLDNLCWIYDNNHITIEGNTRITFTEDVAARFLGLSLERAARRRRQRPRSGSRRRSRFSAETKGRPTLIILDSHIGYGSPHKVDTAAAHGEPLGEEEVRLAKRAYGWPEDAKFLVPDGVHRAFRRRDRRARRRGAARLGEAVCRIPGSSFRELATEIDQMQRRELPAGWDRNLPSFPPDPKGIAGRDASGKVLNVLAQNIPWLMGGSADLAPSTRTTLKFAGRRRFRGRDARRPQSAFRHSRARHGGDRQRPVAVEAAGLRLDVLHLQRLCAAGHSALRDDGAADDFRFHP